MKFLLLLPNILRNQALYANRVKWVIAAALKPIAAELRDCAPGIHT